MEEREPISFDPVQMRTRLAERDPAFAEFLEHPLYPDEAAATMPGLYDYYAYGALLPEERIPPGLTAGDFAKAYRDVPHPGGILEETRGGGPGPRRNSSRPEWGRPPNEPDSVTSVDSV